MNADQFAQRQFKAFIDRVLRCREAEDAAKEDTKAVYAEMKEAGYDKAAAGALVREIRDADKNPEKFRDRNAMLDLYRDAYERASGMEVATHRHAGATSTATQDLSSVDHDPATGEITEPENPRPVPTADEEKAGEAVSHSPASPAETNSAHEPQSSPASAEADAPSPAPGASATISDDEIPDFVKKPFARPAFVAAAFPSTRQWTAPLIARSRLAEIARELSALAEAAE